MSERKVAREFWIDPGKDGDICFTAWSKRVQNFEPIHVREVLPPSAEVEEMYGKTLIEAYDMGWKEGRSTGKAERDAEVAELVNAIEVWKIEEEDWNNRITHLKDALSHAKTVISKCKDDYWFMTNLIENYGSDKDQTLKDCAERMKFRAPIFKVLTAIDKVLGEKE